MISVIVPVYNCEKYISTSIQSLIAQTIFNELEIIFIDDGSQDKSAEIIQGYIDKYSNMKIIRQSNKGVSVARNRGIEAASGEYIAFFDADDIAQNTLYERMLDIMVSNAADMSCVNYSMCFADGVTKVHKKQEKKKLYNDEILISFFSSNVLCNNVIDKLFDSSIVKQISFPEGYAIGEDMYFVFQYLLRCEKVIADTTECLYYYYIRDNSAMKSKFSAKYFEPVELSKKMMDIISNDRMLYVYAESNWIHEMCKAMALYYQSGNKEYKEIIVEYRRNIQDYSLVKAFKYLSIKHFVALLMMRYFPRMYIVVYKYLHIG